MRTEFGLLLCLARGQLGAEDMARMEAILRMPIAWGDFVRLARRHRLLPLCTGHLDRLARDVVPAGWMRAMRDYSVENAKRSLLLTDELRTILRLFENDGIPGIAYKGPVLAQQLFGSVALRDMVDLDVLVGRRDVLQARQLLLRHGYRSAAPIDDRRKATILRSGCNFPLVRDSTGVIVELHWTPESSLSEQSLAGLWQRLEHVSVAGMLAPTFGRQDLLPLLCLHGCRHMWERLEWVADVAELLRAEAVPCATLLERSRFLGGRRALLLGLYLAHALLDAPVSEPVLREARAERGMPRLARAARHQLYRDDPTLAHQLGLRFHVFQLRSRERLGDRLRYIGRRGLVRMRQPWPTRTSTAPTGTRRSGRGERPMQSSASATLLVALAIAALPGGPRHAAAQTGVPETVPARVEAVLRPGDVIRISVWRKPELSGEFQVADDSTVAAPFYMDVRVGGVPFPEAAARIRTHLGRYESQPQVLVEPLLRVAVGGEVQRPGVYTFGRSTTISQAVLLAGGPTERGNLRRVQLYRAGDQLRVDLKDPRDRLAGSPIRSGDYLVVESTRPVFREYVLPALLALGATASIARLLVP